MTHDVTAAVVSVAVLGLWFTSTRVIALAAIGFLSLRYPALGPAVLVASVVTFLFHIRKP